VLSLSFVVITDGLSLDWTLVLGAILVFLVCCNLYRWASDIGTGSNPCLPCTLPSIQMGFCQLHCAGLCQDHQ
jgi:hypothetical protein